jgi:ArsR family transcriptional regulator
MCVADLCKELDLSQPKVSYHLKILLDAELIERRVAGTWSYYRLCTDLEGWLKKECKELLKEATIN